jgi:hypothetical protein
MTMSAEILTVGAIAALASVTSAIIPLVKTFFGNLHRSSTDRTNIRKPIGVKMPSGKVKILINSSDSELLREMAEVIDELENEEVLSRGVIKKELSREIIDQSNNEKRPTIKDEYGGIRVYGIDEDDPFFDEILRGHGSSSRKSGTTDP